MNLLLRLLAMMLVIALAPEVIDGIRVSGYGAALVAAVIYSVLAVLIGWLVRLVVTVLSIVPGLLTFGLFFLLVPILANAVLLKMTAGLITRFEIRTWTAAFLLGMAISVLNAFFERRARRQREQRDEYESRRRRHARD